MRLTLIHPCIGRQPGQRYIRSWQMEPLPPATIAGLTPKDVEIRFYDDRMEEIPYDEPTDLVAMSVETYTAKRADLVAMANELFDVVKSGKVKIEINQTYALKDATKAHTDLQSRKTTGSTVLLP